MVSSRRNLSPTTLRVRPLTDTRCETLPGYASLSLRPRAYGGDPRHRKRDSAPQRMALGDLH